MRLKSKLAQIIWKTHHLIATLDSRSAAIVLQKQGAISTVRVASVAGGIINGLSVRRLCMCMWRERINQSNEWMNESNKQQSNFVCCNLWQPLILLLLLLWLLLRQELTHWQQIWVDNKRPHCNEEAQIKALVQIDGWPCGLLFFLFFFCFGFCFCFFLLRLPIFLCRRALLIGL